MSELNFLAVGVVLLAAFLLLSLLVLALYSGLLSEVTVRSGPPPIGAFTVAYKYKQGSYREAGRLFTEITSIAPKLSSIGIYYDTPKKEAAEKPRYIAGSILSEGEEKPSEELIKLFEKFGFKIISFPEVTHVVMTTFPFTTFLSLFIAMYRVYPILNNYVKERKLCAHPCLEIYRGDMIYYMCPLARQGDFYVPELKEADKKQKEEEGDDALTDTGVDSFSEKSSETYEAYTESRETSMAKSETTTLSNKEAEDSEKSDKSESAASGSSFEELDLEAQDNGVSPQSSDVAKKLDEVTETDIRRMEEE
ncbi:testis-expressed protein 264 homolog isoform X2 [Chiloscyllium plagiosum]|uniref:testis-expressed protein 264 homolog isoform X2 n=1 Tax=Chiloscyllium plagiosum TaxID=36176 RepID=UPI001CB84F34|nr:testis-expressed protein 264 homolog isoform X2 [Chiloscyllium plagiosum]